MTLGSVPRTRLGMTTILRPRHVNYVGQHTRPEDMAGVALNVEYATTLHDAAVTLSKQSRHRRRRQCTQLSQIQTITQSQMATCLCIRCSRNREWHAVLDINGRGLKVKIDTGASCNVMSKPAYDVLNARQPTDIRLCKTKHE